LSIYVGAQVAEFDLIVLGGGSGGLATAQRAAEYGARAAVLEPNRLGGTCVNVGCVPKKVMWNAAELAGALAAARDYGFDLKLGRHDFAALKRARDGYVARLNGIYAENLAKKGIRHVPAAGRFEGPGEIADADGERYRAHHIVIATGGTPIRPDIEGASLSIDSDGFFELDSLPERVAIVGGGYVATELGGVLHALGSRVSMFLRRERLLGAFDAMLGNELMAQMAASGIEIVTGAVPTAIESDGKLCLRTEAAGRHAGFDLVLFAIGRRPNTAALGLDTTAVVLTGGGHVVVDEYQSTAEAGIHAIGDVTGRAELTPVAIAAGRRLADRLFGGQPESKLSYEIIPTVIFSHPPIGTIGLSEEEARAKHGDGVKTYSARFVGLFNAITESKPRTAMKLVVAGDEERVVGCHAIGAGADEMMQGFAVAMTLGARKRDFDATIAIHPTVAEELVTMR
jgi:glutathione reductase (NADPH)